MDLKTHEKMKDHGNMLGGKRLNTLPDETKDIKDKDEADFHIWAKNLSIKHCSQYKYLDKFIDWVDGGKNSG